MSEDRICLKALAKRASERYSTAADFADDLHHFLAGSPVTRAAPRYHKAECGFYQEVKELKGK